MRGNPVTDLRFTIPLAAAHALLDEAIFAPGVAPGLAVADVEFQDSNSGAETRIGCSLALGRLILETLRRLVACSSHDAELSFALTEAAVVVQQTINSHIEDSEE
jgi:hypothetical protein